MAQVWVCASWPDPRSKGQGCVGHLELQIYCSAINVRSLLREIQPFLLLGWRSSSPFHGLNEPFWFKPAPEVKPEGVYWVQMAFATAQSCVWQALSWWRWIDFLLAHSPPWKKNRKKKKSSRHFLAFRAAKPGAETRLYCQLTPWVLQPGWKPPPSCPQASSLCFFSDAGWQCLLPVVPSLDLLLSFFLSASLCLSWLFICVFSCLLPFFSVSSSSFLTVLLFVGNATWPLEGEAVNIEDTSTVSSFESTMRSQRWHPLTPKDQSCLGNNNLTSSARMMKCGECWSWGSYHDQWGTVARWPWRRRIQGKQAGLDWDRAMIAVGRGSETNFMLKD